MRRTGLGRLPVANRRRCRRRRRRMVQNLPSFQQVHPKPRARAPKGRSRRGQYQPEQRRNAQKGQPLRRDPANSLGRRSPTGEPSGRSGEKRPRLRRQASILLRDVDDPLERISEYSHFARRPDASRTTAQPGSRNRRRGMRRDVEFLTSSNIGTPTNRADTRATSTRKTAKESSSFTFRWGALARRKPPVVKV